MKFKIAIIISLLSLGALEFEGCTGNAPEQKKDLPDSVENISGSIENIQGEKIPFQRTGFPETCKAISRILKDTSNRKGKISCFDGRTYENITFDSLGSILYDIYLFDTSNDDYELYRTNCNGLETSIWKQSKKAPAIKRQTYKVTTHLSVDSGKVQLLLTDYIIHRSDFPKLIELRVIDSTSLTQLLIDDNVFTPNYEMAPINIQRIYAIFDSIKSHCKN